jgi:hypothetical protein
MKPFIESTDIANDPQRLRERAGQDGCLFFRHLIDSAKLNAVRRDILEVLSDIGWLAPGRPLMDGIADLANKPVEGDPTFAVAYDRIQKIESFHDLAHDPALLAVLDRLFGEPTLVHPRNIARIIFPQNVKYTTPAHQDFIHIHGTPETWTAWIPLSDCPASLGNIEIMEGSHRSGIYETHAAYGAGGRGVDTDDLPFEWRGGDFELGDVLLFHSHALHRATHNESRDRLRLSVDYRYQGATQPVTRGSLLPHHGRLSWDEIYADWKSTERQRYWENMPLTIEE